jgi:hypothetical protein
MKFGIGGGAITCKTLPLEDTWDNIQSPPKRFEESDCSIRSKEDRIPVSATIIFITTELPRCSHYPYCSSCKPLWQELKDGYQWYDHLTPHSSVLVEIVDQSKERVTLRKSLIHCLRKYHQVI